MQSLTFITLVVFEEIATFYFLLRRTISRRANRPNTDHYMVSHFIHVSQHLKQPKVEDKEVLKHSLPQQEDLVVCYFIIVVSELLKSYYCKLPYCQNNQKSKANGCQIIVYHSKKI